MIPRVWLGVAGVACLLLFTPPALAQDAGTDAGGQPDGGSTVTPGAIIAHYCGDAEMRCMVTPIDFHYEHNLFPQLADISTGWVPTGSKIQVNFGISIPTTTKIDMAGKFRAQWPEAITLDMPGRRFGGLLQFHYGIETHALLRFTVKVLGKTYKWQGDIPKIPKITFGLHQKKSFDTWAYDPENPVEAVAVTDPQQLIELNLLGMFTNIPSDVGKAGLTLDIKGKLKATYYTEEIVFRDDWENSPNDFTLINTKGAQTTEPFIGGPFVEYQVSPKGHLKYDGSIVLIPNVFIEVLHQWKFKMPVYSYEVNITDLLKSDLARTVKYDPVVVHVPLPDILPFSQKVIDFGKVTVGAQGKADLNIENNGEAEALAVGSLDPTDPHAAAFRLQTTSVNIEPNGGAEKLGLRFRPKQEGEFEAVLTIKSNDPDLPMQTVLLKGNAVPEELADYPEDDGGTGTHGGGDGGAERLFPGAGDDAGCGCRVAGTGGSMGSTGSTGSVGLAMLGLGLWMARRRRSRDDER